MPRHGWLDSDFVGFPAAGRRARCFQSFGLTANKEDEVSTELPPAGEDGIAHATRFPSFFPKRENFRITHSGSLTSSHA